MGFQSVDGFYLEFFFLCVVFMQGNSWTSWENSKYIHIYIVSIVSPFVIGDLCSKIVVLGNTVHGTEIRLIRKREIFSISTWFTVLTNYTLVN